MQKRASSCLGFSHYITLHFWFVVFAFFLVALRLSRPPSFVRRPLTFILEGGGGNHRNRKSPYSLVVDVDKFF